MKRRIQNDGIFGPKMKSFEKTADTFGQDILLIFDVLEMFENRFQFRLNSSEIQRVDNSLEELFSDPWLTRRRSGQEISEKLLREKRLERVVNGRVQDHLAPLVDGETVGVDGRTFKALADNLQGFFE